MFLLVSFAFQGRGISFEQPAAPAGTGPDWPLQLLTLLEARVEHGRADTDCRYKNVWTVSYPDRDGFFVSLMIVPISHGHILCLLS